jgi:hypothetical protein
MALQNGQLSNIGQWRATRISPPDGKPQNKGSMGTLVWKQAHLTSTGHARTIHWPEHNHVHPLQPGTTGLDQGRHLLGLITCLVQPEKIDELNRTRLVAGEDRVHYPSNGGMPSANLLTIKLLINSTIYSMGAKVHDHGHIGFLPKHHHGLIQVHAIETLQHTGQHDQTLHMYLIYPSTITITTSTRLQLPMALFIARHKKACMGFHKWA